MMTIPAAQDPSLGFVPGDHVCASYRSSRNVLDDIVVDYITKGLPGGNKVCCLYDLDLFDGDTVMHVLRTHPRVYVNGIFHRQSALPGRTDSRWRQRSTVGPALALTA
jgi:hypothetical protein